jgi:hypothetical protein
VGPSPRGSYSMPWVRVLVRRGDTVSACAVSARRNVLYHLCGSADLWDWVKGMHCRGTVGFNTSHLSLSLPISRLRRLSGLSRKYFQCMSAVVYPGRWASVSPGKDHHLAPEHRVIGLHFLFCRDEQHAQP